jgi:hypothetical protein
LIKIKVLFSGPVSVRDHSDARKVMEDSAAPKTQAISAPQVAAPIEVQSQPIEKSPAAAEVQAVPTPRRFIATDASIAQVFESGRFPYSRPIGTRDYEAKKAKLQAELLKVQIWAQDTGQKFVVLMEGRDAAGKGGTI